MGLGVFGAAAAWRDDLSSGKDGFSSSLLFLPHPRYKKIQAEKLRAALPFK